MTRVVPAEWSEHRAMWVGYPSHPELWEENLEPARVEVASLVRALTGPGAERVRLLVRGDEAETDARRRLLGVPHVEIVRGQFGDIWLRDTGPLFLTDSDDRSIAVGFRFNGWGGKYVLEDDDSVAEQLAAAAGAPLERCEAVVEGGALDHDGSGTVLTTRQCLLNPNRENGWAEVEAEGVLARTLGARRVLWLGEGLLNDHTDGHVDNLARFVAPGVVACPVSWGPDDPNAAIYDETARTLKGMTGERGAPLTVSRIASPGRIEVDGEVVPASHMNFVIANKAVIVPLYGDDRAGQFAMDALASLFPEREVIGLPSLAILSGGGSFHCITQQEPA